MEVKYVPADNYIESDVRLCGKRAFINVEVRRHADNVPCAALPIIRQIDKVFIVVERERDLVTVKSP